MRRHRRSPAVPIVSALLLLACARPIAAEAAYGVLGAYGGVVPHDVSASCLHIAETAPTCKHNSTLFAYQGVNSKNGPVQQDNCATCVCASPEDDKWAWLNRPERGADVDHFDASWGKCCAGWNGTACDVCQDVSACPAVDAELDDGTVVRLEPVGCSAGVVEPETQELEKGKKYSCTPCGPGSDSAYCKYIDLPGASFDVTAFTDRATLAMRLGTHVSTDDKFTGQNAYEFAAMLTGEMTGCSFGRGACAWDNTKICITLTCQETSHDCPPKGLVDCPGFTYDPCSHKHVCENECVKKNFAGCCVASKNDDDEIQHGKTYHIAQRICCDKGSVDDCEVTELFWNHVATTFSCEVKPLDGAIANARRCYLNQKHTGVDDGFPYTCHVGNCLYNSTNSSGSLVDDDAARTLTAQAAVGWQLILLGCCAVLAQFAIAAGYALAPLNRPCTLQGMSMKAATAAAARRGGASEPCSAVALDVSWKRVTMQCGDFEVLRDMGGFAKSGHVTAFLGPSGAGKSSLLSAIGGRGAGRVSGEVSVGGVALDAFQRRATMALVPQHDDGLTATLTVAEHLALHARLRCADRAFDAVEESIAMFELGNCRDRRLGKRASDDPDAADDARGISGGEARRVSVATELLSQPRVVLLDEPTSRVDARQALQLVQSLRRVARGSDEETFDDDIDGVLREVDGVIRNRGIPTVALMATMHQPRSEIFDFLLDSVFVLAGGRVAWSGCALAAAALAKKLVPSFDPLLTNAADVLLDTIAKDTLATSRSSSAILQLEAQDDEDDDRGAAFPAEDGAKRKIQAALRDATFERVGFGAALRVLVERQLVQTVRSPALLLLNLGGSLCAAIALGSIDHDVPRNLGGVQRRIGAVFFALFFQTLLALSALSALREDAGVFDVERKSFGGLYSARARFLSIVVVDALALRLAPALVFASVVYPLVGLRRRCAGYCALRFAAALSLSSCAAGFAAMALAACRFSTSVTTALGALGVLFAALFGGVAIDVDSDADTSQVAGGTGVVSWSNYVVKFAASCDAMFYAFRAAVVGELAGAKDGQGRPLTYLIDGHKCDKSFPTVTVNVDAILATLDLPNRAYQADNALLQLAFVTFVTLIIAALVDVIRSGDDTFLSSKYFIDCFIDWLRTKRPRRPGGESEYSELEGGGELSPPGPPLDGFSEDGVRDGARERSVSASPVAIAMTFLSARLVPPCPRHASDDGGGDDDDESDDDARDIRCLDYGDITLQTFLSFQDGAQRYEAFLDGPAARRLGDRVGAVGGVEAFKVLKSLDAFINACRPQLGLQQRALQGALHSVSKVQGASIALLDALPNLPLDAAPLSDAVTTLELVSHDASDGMAAEGAMLAAADAEGLLAAVEGVASALVRIRTGLIKCLEKPLLVQAFRVSAEYVSKVVLLEKATPDLQMRGVNMTITVSENKFRVLDDCSLQPVAQGLTALLGPSGAGKSSLLDVLAGRRTSGRVRGSVLVGGCAATPTQLRRLSAYAPQDDVLPAALTAMEHLAFHARLRLPKDWPTKRTKRAARREARRLGLEARLDVRLDALSGGQRRRVTIACELLARKRFLFADEPTTGLDAATALLVCRRLSAVAARSRCTVVAVLHQPRREIFAALDSVALVAKGRIAFYGSPFEARVWLEERNVFDSAKNAADLLVDACSALGAAEAWTISPLNGSGEAPRSPGRNTPLLGDGANASPRSSLGDGGCASPSRRPSSVVESQCAPRSRAFAPFGYQITVLAYRELTNVWRDKVALALHYVPPVILGAVLGGVYSDMPGRNHTSAGIQDRLGLAFILCAYTGLSTLTAPPRCRRATRLFARERDSYTAGPAFVASAIIGDALCLRIAPPILLSLTTGLASRCCATRQDLFGFVAATTQLHYAFAAVGRLIGSIAPRDAVAAAGASLALLFSLLLCGFFVAPTDLSKGWYVAGYVLPASHGFEALAIHQFEHVTDLFITSKIGGQSVRSPPYGGEQILHCFGFGAGAVATQDHVFLAWFGIIADAATALSYWLFAFERR